MDFSIVLSGRFIEEINASSGDRLRTLYDLAPETELENYTHILVYAAWREVRERYYKLILRIYEDLIYTRDIVKILLPVRSLKRMIYCNYVICDR